MKSKRIVVLVVILIVALLNPLFAITIKLGSVAPANSPYNDALKELAAEWKRITGGRVDVKIYAGGIAGTEADMLRKMRIGQLQAAILTNMGLNKINSDMLSLSVPIMFNSDEEFMYVMDKVRPFFEQLIQEKGFRMLTWTMAGWVNFFAKKPVVYPEDLKPLKMASFDGEPAITQAWKTLGYNPINVPFTELMIQLQSNALEAIIVNPLVAASYQWFALANNMCNLPVTPMIGAIVINESDWKKIPDQYKEDMLKAADNIGKTIYTKTKEIEKEAMKIMQQNGLKVIDIPKDAQEKWKKDTFAGFMMLKGKTFSDAAYERIERETTEYRKLYGN